MKNHCETNAQKQFKIEKIKNEYGEFRKKDYTCYYCYANECLPQTFSGGMMVYGGV